METKPCQNCKNNFTIESDDFSFYEKMKVPAPTFCPDCRMQRRMAYRNDTSLYNRKCDLCGVSIVSSYAPDCPIIVYCNKCWWSDKWDPMDYGVDYDFNKPFFTQFFELMYRVPHIAIVNDEGISSIGCSYTNDTWFSKNCYMLFAAWRVENVMYSFLMTEGKDIADCSFIFIFSEKLYECINCNKSFRLKNSQNCVACIESAFLYDCKNCSDCFMCGSLRNKRYCFKNQQYSKEAYEEILASYKLDTYDGVQIAQKEYDDFIKSIPRRYANIIQSVSSSGDYITNSKNTKNSFRCYDAENVKFYQVGGGGKDSYDLSVAGELSESYEGMVVDHSNHNYFGVYSVKSQDIYYTMHCHSSKYLFGCVGIKKGEYTIFNKRYTKEEYEILVDKIKKQMSDMPYVDKLGCTYKYGEFYPIELSPFGYNETNAQQYFPLSREQTLKNNYKYQDNIQKTTGKQTLDIVAIPQSIKDVSDSITDEILECIECKRNFKITPAELLLYRSMNIPVPHSCFYCRYDARFHRLNPFKLYSRTCMCDKKNHLHGNEMCTVAFETSYSPDRPEIVYCEKCYQAEVV